MKEEKPPDTNNQLTTRQKFALYVITLVMSVGVSAGMLIKTVDMIDCKVEDTKLKDKEQDKEIKENRERLHKVELNQREQIVLMTGIRNDTSETRELIKDQAKEIQRIKEMVMQWEIDDGQIKKEK